MGIMTKCYTNKSLVWPALLAQVWTHYKIGKLNMWTLFCKACIDFLNNQIWKEIMLELNGKPSSVTTFSTDFSFQNLVFGIYLNFQQQKSLKDQYLPHSASKSYQINSIIFSEEIIQYSRTFALQVQTLWNQANAPLLVESFQRHQEHNLKHPGLVDLITTKQTSFLHR